MLLVAMPPEVPELLLVQAFFDGGRLTPARFSSAPQLEETLRSLWEAGRKAWPQVELAPASFVRHLCACLPHDGDSTRLASVHATDLYLACACALGDPEALARFDRHFLPVAAEVLLRNGADTTWVDEVQQVLRQKLFVGRESRAPRIAEYSGVGPLKSWVRATAVRAATDLRRGEDRAVPLQEGELAEMELLTADPELEFLKSRYRRELKEAFALALQALPDRDLNVLRFYLVDGLNIDKIGQLYGTHRATAARWIAGAREFLLDESRRILGERLRVTPEEFNSLVRLVRSNLDLSIMRFLRERSPAPEFGARRA
jgi:RNA polymerase sigma-70 factor (ECF subfamily)